MTQLIDPDWRRNVPIQLQVHEDGTVVLSDETIARIAAAVVALLKQEKEVPTKD